MIIAGGVAADLGTLAVLGAGPKAEVVARYEYRALVARLAEVFDRAAERRPG